MTARIFEYKGNVGVEIDMEGKFINDPFAQGQLGCVISTKEIQIMPSAIEVIKKSSREGGSFASLMLTKHEGAGEEHGKSSIGIMGGGKINFGKDISIGRDCDLEVLNDCEILDFEAPEDYKTFIDELDN